MTIVQRINVYEPVPLQDLFVCGIQRIEITGPMARISWFIEQNCQELNEIERKIVSQMITPVVYLPSIATAITRVIEPRIMRGDRLRNN